MGPNGGPDKVWIQQDPEVSTPDGRWWVDHADVWSPQSSEFTRVPHLEGVATAQDPNDADLEYELEGSEYIPPSPPGSPPYAVTAALDSKLQLVNESTPLEEGSDEPADGDPPGSH